MNRTVYLNGALIDEADARVSIFDRGLLFGDGIFETIRVYGGRGHLLGRHLERLRRGAGIIGVPCPPVDELAAAIGAVVRSNGAGEAVVRLTLTRGVGEAVGEFAIGTKPTVIITHKPLLHNEGMPEPAHLGTVSVRHMPPAIGTRVKALNYLPAAVALLELRNRGLREGVLVTADGTVAEGTVSNVFFRAGDVLYTPPLSLGILPGVTRGRVIELARDLAIEVREEPFTMATMLAADECFTTNSVREIAPVASIDGVPLGKGTGTMAGLLFGAYRAEVPMERG